ncbi:MAG: dihydrodipicolinate synthase family protein [Bacteroidales bacterium]|nr:dihydrodipicolinate synthase family protein [Bacteroidales bacterium]
MRDLSGIYPPLPTSFRKDESLWPEMITRNIKSLLKHPLAGILVLGSNGEMVMLDEKEKETVYSTAREAIPADRIMIAGTGGQSTRETIRLTIMAASHGADAVLVLNPSYYRGLMTTPALRDHYFAVADESPVPVLIYNMPANSGMDMDAQAIALFAGHKNIIGVKDSGGNLVKMSEIARLTPRGFNIFAGSASFLLPAMTVGATGGILALANVAPELCLGIRKNFLSGNMETASALQRRAVPLNSAVTSAGGVPALKCVMDEAGLYGGAVRRPLQLPEEEKRKELIALFKAENIV